MPNFKLILKQLKNNVCYVIKKAIEQKLRKIAIDMIEIFKQ